MRPLILDQKDMDRLREFAEGNPIYLDQMRKIMRMDDDAPGDWGGYTLILPLGFKVVFTVEEHPGGWMRHLSASSPEAGKLPSIQAVQMIMRSLGFEHINFDGLTVYEEEFDAGHKAINVIEKIEEDGKGA